MMPTFGDEGERRLLRPSPRALSDHETEQSLATSKRILKKKGVKFTQDWLKCFLRSLVKV